MERVVSLSAQRNAQRQPTLANLAQRLQAGPLRDGESELVERRNDRDRAQRDRRRKRSGAAHRQREKSGGIADRKLHGAASDLRDRSRPIARDHVDGPSVRALRTQAHLRLAVRPARPIDYFGSDL